MNKINYQVGSIVSADLTVPDANQLKTFYKQVIGWEPEALEMKDEAGTYADYVMKDEGGNWAGGICHLRGVNQGIPPQWMVYIQVNDIAESIKRCTDLGGKLIKESRKSDGTLQYAMLQDPAGAILAVTNANG